MTNLDAPQFFRSNGTRDGHTQDDSSSKSDSDFGWLVATRFAQLHPLSARLTVSARLTAKRGAKLTKMGCFGMFFRCNSDAWR